MSNARWPLAIAFGLLYAAVRLSGCEPELRRAPSPIPGPPQAAKPSPGETAPFVATAYSSGQLTASGAPVRPGVVAVDPSVIPLGSRLRVYDAGGYSHEYIALDTGGKIRGQKIDIYMPRRTQAKRFGRRQVRVKVVRYGHYRYRAHHARHRLARFHRLPRHTHIGSKRHARHLVYLRRSELGKLGKTLVYSTSVHLPFTPTTS